MKIQAILPTAGSGTRLRTDTLKPFIEICGKPLFMYALETFEQSSVIVSVILVGQKDKLSELESVVKQYNLKKVAHVVAGGKTRRDSVANGIAVLDDDTDVVVVHDGARPLVSLDTIESAVDLCQDWDAVVSAVPVQSTVKRVGQDQCVEETLKRDGLWEIQTPQVFKKDVLIKAHTANKEINATDDAMLVEKLDIKVKISPGDGNNIKVTTQENLLMVEALVKIDNGLAVRK